MTIALYNDTDPFAAAWLRELIRHDHIPQGAVIDKSITDLQPEDVFGHGQRHLFAGIGGWAHALDLAGVRRDADIWTGSCPCQPLSDAGKGRGFSDPRHLWPAWFSLIRECRPPVIFGEQVASKLGLEWLDLVFADLERCGYAVGAADLCAAGVGAPHQRQRLFFVAYAVGLGREQVESLLLPEREPRGDLPEADRGGKAGGTRRLVDVPVHAGATRGFWADAEWILCRDPAGGPPVARPVEPGTFPLSHGVPGRVGKLRGYGNGIVPQVGAAFIRAFLETWRQR